MGLILGVKEKNRILKPFLRCVFSMEILRESRLLTDTVGFVWEFLKDSIFCWKITDIGKNSE